jgi:hypothetical protein
VKATGTFEAAAIEMWNETKELFTWGSFESSTASGKTMWRCDLLC